LKTYLDLLDVRYREGERKGGREGRKGGREGRCVWASSSSTTREEARWPA